MNHLGYNLSWIHSNEFMVHLIEHRESGSIVSCCQRIPVQNSKHSINTEVRQ